MAQTMCRRSPLPSPRVGGRGEQETLPMVTPLHATFASDRLRAARRPAQVVAPFDLRDAMIQIVDQLRERLRRAHIARTQAQPQPQPVDESGDSEDDGLTLVRRNEGRERRHQVRTHAGVDYALDAGKLRLTGNLGAEDEPGVADFRLEEFRAEIAVDDRPQALFRAAR